MNDNRKKPYGVSIGPEEHRRLKILAAEKRVSMSVMINEIINDLWDQYKQKEKPNAKGYETVNR